jgi:hypothetical protein
MFASLETGNVSAGRAVTHRRHPLVWLTAVVGTDGAKGILWCARKAYANGGRNDRAPQDVTLGPLCRTIRTATQPGH